MPWRAGAHIHRCLRRPGINSEELICKFQHRAGIFKQSMGTRKRVGIGLLYRPTRARICNPFNEPGINSQPGGPVWQPYLLYRLARLHRLAESIPGLLKCLQIRAKATLAIGIDSLESIPRLHNMKNEDKDKFFIQAKKNEYIHTLTKEGTKKNELLVPILSKERRQTKVFVPQLPKERRHLTFDIWHCYIEWSYTFYIAAQS